MSNPFENIQSIIDDLNRSFSVYNSVAAQVLSSTSTANLIQESLAAQRKIDRDIIASATSVLATARLPDYTSNIRDLISANKALTDLVSQASVTDSVMSQMFKEHNALRKSLESIATLPPTTEFLASVDANRLLHTSLSSQIRLLDLEKRSFGNLIGATNLFSNDLTATFSKLTSSYRDVIESIPNISERFAPFIINHVPLEYALELDVVEAITIEADDDQEPEPLPSVDDELASFDKKLRSLLNGARQSLYSDNPEKARHVTTSVRELFTHILHELAPDSEIKRWTTDDSHYHDDRPTRRARLLFICRHFSCDPLTKFIESDVQAVLMLVDSLNAGTHAIESKLTQSQLQAIVYRMESLVLFLLKVSREGD
jgi:hypothetical protein